VGGACGRARADRKLALIRSLIEDHIVKSTDTGQLNRREFNCFCVALGSLATVSGAAAVVTGDAAAADAPRMVKFPDGTVVPALGQGSAGLGKGRHPAPVEEEALRTGLSLGMTLIDTAEVYGSEEFIGRAIAGQRGGVFLVSKVWPNHVAGDGIARACEASLKRLGTDYLDLYLLHWPNGVTNLAAVVTGFESLRAAGKIRAWGVSNFSVSQLEGLLRIPRGDHCATNQVPYSIADRGIEHDMLPWCERHAMPVMAYSPLGGAGSNLLRDATLARVGAAHGCSAAAVALAWTIRSGHVIAIPESGSVAHVKENAIALSLTLTPQELAALDAVHPPPRR
jgi:diketogulonate reductase-like aldo/keto reductase